MWALLVCQFAGCVLFSAAALAYGITTAYSVLLGGLICLLPNTYFAYRAFRFQGARAAKQIVQSFYAGEAGKLALTTILFAGVFIGVKPLNALALFIGYLSVQFHQLDCAAGVPSTRKTTCLNAGISTVGP